jgi:hypothetical protein
MRARLQVIVLEMLLIVGSTETNALFLHIHYTIGLVSELVIRSCLIQYHVLFMYLFSLFIYGLFK